MEEKQLVPRTTENRKFIVTAVEACMQTSVVDQGVEAAKKCATALLARRYNCRVEDGALVSAIDLTGNLQLHELGVVARVIELTPSAATC